MTARKTLLIILLLLAGYLAVYVLPLGSRPLVMPDETRYAEIPREMLASHDFIVPRLAGLRYFEKPVMGHWINAFFIHLAGKNAFAVRISSAISAAISALIVSLLLFHSGDKSRRSSVWLTPAVFLTGFSVFVIGIYSCLDGIFAKFLTGTLVSFFAAYRESGRQHYMFLLLSGAFCGCAFLTKGFVAFAFIGVVAAPFLLWERQWKKLFTMAWLPLAAIVAVAAPWCIAIHLREPDFWHYFVVIEHLHRFSSSDAQHAEPVWYYVPMLLEGMVPWIFILPAAIRGLAANRLKDPLVRFALCWFVFPFIFFTLSDGKLGTYLLPIFPAFAILTVFGLQKYFADNRLKGFVIGTVLLSVVIAAAAGAFFFIPSSLWASRCTLLCSPAAFKTTVLGAAAVWSILAAYAGLKSRLKPESRVFIIAAGTAVFLSTLHFSSSVLLPERKTPVRFLESHQTEIMQNTLLVSDSYMAPSICWVYERKDVYILRYGGELAYGLEAEDSEKHLAEFADFNELVKKHAGENRVVLFLKQNTYKQYAEMLAEPASVDAENGFVFVRY